MPVTPSDTFWQHVPVWLWPVIIAGVAGFFVYEAIRASKTIAALFGGLGDRIHSRGKRLQRIEASLEQTNDKLDCAMEYLADDCAWHYETDIIIGENYPGLTKLLPYRIPFTQWKQKWAAGWRPDSYGEV
jgi:hypothetical protein